MTRETLSQFEDTLRRIERELQYLIQTDDPTRDSITPDKAIGRLTRMEAIQAQSMSNEGRRRQEQRLTAVRRALERIEMGTYAICMRCGEPIPKGRLEIMPESPFCVRCASRT